MLNQACELTREIYTEVLPYLNIPMTEQLTEKEMEELDSKGIYTSAVQPADEEMYDGDIIENTDDIETEEKEDNKNE